MNFLGIFSIFVKVVFISCHGRLLDPPARTSAWREDSRFPPFYNDAEMFCGGFDTQWRLNSNFSFKINCLKFEKI